MGSRISRLVCCNESNINSDTERSLVSGRRNRSNISDARAKLNAEEKSYRNRDALSGGERYWVPGSKDVVNIEYPTEDEWYKIGKTGLPKNGSGSGIVTKQRSIGTTLASIGVSSRSTRREVSDKTDKTGKTTTNKTVTVVNSFGELVSTDVARGVSKESIEWFEHFMDRYNIKINHYCNSGAEKVIKLHTGKIAKVDGYCEKYNIVFEYHGSFYHGDPDKYKRNRINGLTKKRFGDLYKTTRDRDMDILLSGYNLCTIWGSGSNYDSKVVTFFMLKHTANAA